MKTHDEQTFFYDMFEEMWPKDKADVIDLNAEHTHLEVSRIQEALHNS